LSDDEYFWEPVEGCGNVRARGPSTAPLQGGSGAFTIDFEFPEPNPPPVTTIAWRLAHLVIGIFGSRAAEHFGGPEVAYESFDYAGSASQALDQLDQAYGRWIRGVGGLTHDDLGRPCGEDGFAERSMAALVLHINREAIHHCGEIALLRDLYARGGAATLPPEGAP
jgi:hypothetical protein